MDTTVWTIRGIVKNVTGEMSIPDVDVEAWCGQVYAVTGNEDGATSRMAGFRETRDVRIGAATTDSNGRFRIEFDENSVGSLRKNLGPAFYFKFFHNDELYYVSADSFFGLEDRDDWVETFLLPERATAASNTGWVIGHVKNHDENSTITSATVRIYNKSFTGEELIDSATISPLPGTYAISYDKEKLQEPDIIARLEYGQGSTQEAQLVVSAPERVQIDLYIPRDSTSEQTEFTEVDSLLSEKFKSVPTSVTKDQLLALARTSGLSLFQVQCYAASQMMRRDCSAYELNIPTHFLYALTRQGMPRTIHALASKSEPELLAAAAASTTEGITGTFANPDPYVAGIFNYLAAELNAKLGTDDNKIVQTSEAMTLASLTSAQKSEYLGLISTHNGDSDSFWTAVGNLPSFTGALAEKLEFACTAAAIVLYHSPMTPLVVNSSLTRQQNIDILVGYSQAQWLAFAAQNGVGRPADFETNDDYVDAILETVEKTYPSSRFVIKAQGNVSPEGTFPTSVSLLSSAPEDDFDKVDIEALTTNDTFRTELRNIRSLYRIAPAASRYESVNALYAGGMTSAMAISRSSKKNFISGLQTTFEGIYQGTDATESTQNALEILTAIHNAAVGAVSSSVLTGSANFSQSVLAEGAFFSSANQPPGSSVEVPNLDSLFGTNDAVDIKHCRSVLGPSAYFVDCLEYIKRSEYGETALDDRRPDLKGIKLSCGNTNLTLPYTDLVIELLEDVENGNPPQARQTDTEKSIEELRACPEHIQHGVYNTLRAQVHPYTFDFGRDAASAYLSMKGVARHEIMRLFQSSDPDPTDTQIACEVLGLCPQDYQVLLGTTPVADLYGGTTTDLEQVEKLLDKAFLPYDDFAAIMSPDSMAYQVLNSNKIYEVDYTGLGDPEVDLPSLSLATVSTDGASTFVLSNYLMELYRYRLLLRKTGWSVETLNKVLSTLGISLNSLNCDIALANLARIKTIETDFGISAEELVAWWNDEESYPSTLETLGIENDEQYELWKNALDIDPVDGLNSATNTLNFAQKQKAFAACGFGAEDTAYLVGKIDPVFYSGATTPEDIGAFAVELQAGADEAIETAVNNEFGDQTTGAQKSAYIEKVVASYLAEALASEFTIDAEILGGILENYFLYGLSGNTLLAALVDGELKIVDYTSGTGVVNPNFESFYYNLHRLGLFASLVNLHDSLVGYLKDNDRYFTDSWFPFDTSYPFPLGTLLEVVKAETLSSEFFGSDKRIYDILCENISLDQATVIAQMAGWSFASSTTFVSDVQDTVNKEGEASYNIAILEKACNACELLLAFQETGVELTPTTSPPGMVSTLEMVAAWGAFGLWNAPADASTDYLFQQIVEKVKATFPNAELLRKEPEVRDPLRAAQRDILQAKAIAGNTDINNVHELYSYYLLDTEMEPINQTSRMKMAMSSLQTFIQRALMGLEADSNSNKVAFSDELTEEWKWRRNYRVWEANRKVFLYPENWIEPELRDDKTPFFQELEDELMQDEVNADTAERAYLSYLKKLDDVASLEVVGLYKEYDKDSDASVKNSRGARKSRFFDYDQEDSYRLHIFARTKASPHIYYYRSVKEGLWTPWEKMDLEIDSDHILPVMYNRRFYVFWANFTDKYEKKGSGENTEAVYDRTEIQVYWSSKENGIWTQPKMTKDLLDNKGLPNIVTNSEKRNQDNYFLKAYVDQDTNDLYLLTMFSPNKLINSAHGYALAAGQPDSAADVMDAVHAGLHEYGDNVYTDFLVGGFTLGGCSGALNVWMTGEQFSGQPFFLTRPANAKVKAMSFREKDMVYASAFNPSLVAGTQDQRGDGMREFTEFGPAELEVSLLTMGFEEKTDKVYNALHVIEKKGNGCFLDEEDYVRSFFSAFNFKEQKVLGNTPRFFSVVPAHQDPLFVVESPFVYSDDKRTFLVTPSDRYGYRASISNMLPELEKLGTMSAVNKSTLTTTLQNNHLTRASRSGLTRMRVGTERALPNRLKFEGKRTDPNAAAFTEGLSTKVGNTIASGTFSQMASLKTTDMILPCVWQGKTYRFQPLYHPFSCVFIKQLNRYGIDGLLSPGKGAKGDIWDKFLIRQGAVNSYENENYFDAEYDPNDICVDSDYPKDEVDFDLTGPYSAYNWEVFFHVPLMIANQLMANKKFEQAQKWFHYIFDPSSTELDAPQTYWKTKPFYEHSQIVGGPLSSLVDSVDNLELLLKQWRENPFSPHLIARFRRIAYMKNVVMKYLDNLIEWADHLFRRDTMEAINEATQLYSIAAQILGRRPILVQVEEDEPQTYTELTGSLTIADKVGESTVLTNGELQGQVQLLNSMLYFGGAPQNETLLKYWDTVEDRLFKIHNSMNIEGVVRMLALFAPPIDPAMLVRAAAAGMDFGSVVDAVTAARSPYRFTALKAKAVEFVGDLKSLGSSLLSALEKKDAEAISLLRAGHECDMQEAMVQLKEQTIDEATSNLEALQGNKKNVENRLSHYEGLIDEGPLGNEQTARKLNRTAGYMRASASALNSIAGGLASIPNFKVEAGGSGLGPHTTVSFEVGGMNASTATNAAASAVVATADVLSTEAGEAQTRAGWKRREQDWKLQAKSASIELEALDKQIAAAEIRLAIANADLANLKKQIANSDEAYDFLKNKYTKKQLYAWMVGKISGVYFQAYQMAYQMACKAELAYKNEFPEDGNYYIKFDNWDSMRKGLLAGERLHNDLKRLEIAYMEKNRRRMELVRSVSFETENITHTGTGGGLALAALKSSKTCSFDLPSSFFNDQFVASTDAYSEMRIKTVSITIPCVAGPYDRIAARLVLTANQYHVASPSSDESDSLWNSKGVVTSSAMNDAGVFELNFNDDRYLPFEGAGVASSWTLTLPSDSSADLLNSISDVVLHIKYTAKPGS